MLEWLRSRTVGLFESETNPNYGKAPEERRGKEVLDYGFVPLDKPVNHNSFEVVSWVKKLLRVEKAGHSGTLDPSVSGLLPIGLNYATRALSFLLLGEKEYIAVMKLHGDAPEEAVKNALNMFVGAIYQRPPVRSSVKRTLRVRRVYRLDIIEHDSRLYMLDAVVESGTYVRKLVYDIGELLGVGATMVDLRRVRVASYSEADGLVTLQEVWDAADEFYNKGSDEKLRKVVLPIEVALRHLKPIVVKDTAVEALCHGSYLAVPGIARLDPSINQNDFVAMYTLKGEIVAVGRATASYNQIEESQKGIAARVDRVIMKEGTYPKMWRAS